MKKSNYRTPIATTNIITKVKSVKGIENIFPIINPSVDEDSQEAELGITFKQSIFTFLCSFEQLPFCCGVYEIGNFTLHDTKAISFDSKKEGVVRLLTEVLQTLKSKTLIINTIQNPACNLLVSILRTCKLFTEVKKFKNTTGREITMWISNN